MITWIPLAHQLPPKNVDLLVLDHTGFTLKCKRVLNKFRVIGNIQEDFDLDKITHWTIINPPTNAR